MTRVFERPDDALMVLTLYARPRDYPSHYVVRAYALFRGDPNPKPSNAAALFPDELSARMWVMREYPELVQLGRLPGDEPQIVTVWM